MNTPETLELRVLRRLLLAILAFGIIGTLTELVLLEHYESGLQWIPLGGLSLGLLAVAGVAIRPGAAILRGFQMLMVTYLVVGVVGVWFHYRGNVQFAQETYPDVQGFDLVWEALTGATPALAPGTIAHMGLIGLAFTFRHPLLRSRPASGLPAGS